MSRFIPKQTVFFTLKRKVGESNIDGDIFEEYYEEVKGCSLQPETTADQPDPHQSHDVNYMTLFVPSTYTRIVAGASFEAVGGKYAGRIFRVVGDPLPFPKTAVHLPWDRQVRAEEIYR